MPNVPNVVQFSSVGNQLVNQATFGVHSAPVKTWEKQEFTDVNLQVNELFFLATSEEVMGKPDIITMNFGNGIYGGCDDINTSLETFNSTLMVANDSTLISVLPFYIVDSGLSLYATPWVGHANIVHIDKVTLYYLKE